MSPIKRSYFLETEEAYKNYFFQGQYCVDYHIYYADADNEIDFIEGVQDPFACRKKCEATARCRFYSFSLGVGHFLFYRAGQKVFVPVLFT